MRHFLLAVAAATLMFATPTGAAGSPVLNEFILKWQDDARVHCPNDSGITHEMNVCAGRDYKTAYRALVALYNQLYAKYDAADKKLLQASQATWDKYLTDECTYESAGSIGGTLHSTMETLCDTAVVQERIKRLKLQADCEEGDMGCNRP